MCSVNRFCNSDYNFIILSESIPYDEIPSGDFAYFQAAGSRNEGYLVETHQIDSESSNGFWQYRFETVDKIEMVEIFEQYFNGQIPDLSKWEDVTSEFLD